MNVLLYCYGVVLGICAGWFLNACLGKDWDQMYQLGMKHGYERARIGMPLDATDKEGE